jgi:CarD family transcriptional regulator
MTFQVGEKVVYPNHGVGTIENITTRPSGTHFEKFYLLKLSCNSMTVMVPFSHVDEVGLRKVTRAAEITRVLAFLATGISRSKQDWKDRFKENSVKMQKGSLLDIAEVFKQLLILQVDKPLSFREKKMLDRARQMLVSEVCACRQLNALDAVDLLQRALGKSSLNWPEPL